MIEEVQNGRMLGFNLYDDVLRFGSLLYVPVVDNLRKCILAKAHTSVYTIHHSANKTYQDVMCIIGGVA